ncbi:hypothetical protein Efla_002826 [Eimeria flavescens]
MAAGSHKFPSYGSANKARDAHKKEEAPQKASRSAGSTKGQPSTRRVTGRYRGFCPWKEALTEGPGLPPVDRVAVDEHLAACGRCCGSKAQQLPPLQEAEKDKPLCVRCFFCLFVKARRPCVLRLLPKKEPSYNAEASAALADSRALRRWCDLAYLTAAAGQEVIDVEVRDPAGGRAFGAGRYQRLAFGQVLRRLAAGDSSLYVTTQRIASDRYGKSCSFFFLLQQQNATTQRRFLPRQQQEAAGHMKVSASVSLLQQPSAPEMCSTWRNLVPYQFNIWMGDSREGSTTGLHHDFHDNFYCLIRGSKEFRLYSPRLCDLLQTQGMTSVSNDVVLHPNGLISYLKGIREDGAHEASVLHARQMALEKKADDLRRLLNGHEGRCSVAAANARGSNAKHDAAERKRLEEELNQTEAELDRCLDAALDAAAMDEEEADDEASLLSEDISFAEGRLVHEGAFPDHFCLVGTKRASTASWEGPLTADNVLERFWSVWLEEGDVLYLPAGWFHEVVSYSPRRKQGIAGSDASSVNANVHLAFNIWLHPPGWQGSFDEPYPDQFWAEHTAQQIERQQAAAVDALSAKKAFKFPSKSSAGGKEPHSECVHPMGCLRDEAQPSSAAASRDGLSNAAQELTSSLEGRQVTACRRLASSPAGGKRRLLAAFTRLQHLRRRPQSWNYRLPSN